MADVNEAHDPARRSWVKAANEIGCDFPIQNLPFGIFRAPGRGGWWNRADLTLPQAADDLNVKPE
jgi:hypothetical protein